MLRALEPPGERSERPPPPSSSRKEGSRSAARCWARCKRRAAAVEAGDVPLSSGSGGGDVGERAVLAPRGMLGAPAVHRTGKEFVRRSNRGRTRGITTSSGEGAGASSPSAAGGAAGAGAAAGAAAGLAATADKGCGAVVVGRSTDKRVC